MKTVSSHIHERTRQLGQHPFFEWFNGCGRPLEERFSFPPIVADFVMGFADMNKWFLNYPAPRTSLHVAINQHTMEDRSHSMLFVEDWIKLRFDERLGWAPSNTLWWWFLSSETETIRRFAMETLDLSVRYADPLLRFSMIEAVENCGDVFFGNTVTLALALEKQTGLEYRYFGSFHRVKENGHLQADETDFDASVLSAEQRGPAEYLVDRMFDMFTVELDQVLDYSRRATETPALLAEGLEQDFRNELTARGGSPQRWPTGPLRNSGTHPSQTRVVETFERRKTALMRHPLLDWLRNETSVSPAQKLQRFVALWAIDLIGYRDFNRYVLHYPNPDRAVQRAINRWAADLASHAPLYLSDWVALGMDQLLGWPSHRVIEYYFLGDHTEVHRASMAKAKHYAFSYPSPELRYWLLRSLEEGGEILFDALGPLVAEIESKTPARLDYWGHRHYLVHPDQPPDPEADAVAFTELPLNPEEEQIAVEIVDMIFDNLHAQFSLSLGIAEANYFKTSERTEAYLSDCRSPTFGKSSALACVANERPVPQLCARLGASSRLFFGRQPIARSSEGGSNMQDLPVATIDGSMATLGGDALAALAQRLSAGILTSADDEYENARRVWNALVDRRPALIARCTNTEEVAEAVRFARQHDLLTSIRGGGHNIWGTAVCDAGMVIDLSAMKSIKVEVEARRAFAGPGVRWQELDRETQAHGLATPGGQHSEVGIAGFTLGGGLGWLTRKYGLAVDNLRSAEIVTAEGKVLKASATENPDLFWAIRGGGGNFGIVTRFEYELYPVGPVVLCGMALHPFERAAEVLRFLRDFSRDTPDDLHTTAVLMSVPGAGPAVAMVVLYDGPIDAGEEVLRPLRAFGPPLQDMINPMPYTMFQSMMDHTAPAGRCYLDRSRFMTEVDDQAIDTVVKHFGEAPSPPCTVFLHRLGGAMSRVRSDETAFSPRDAQFCLVTSSSWEDPEDADKHIEWTRALLSAMEPFTTGALYLNDLGRAGDEGEAAIRAAFGDNYTRLAALKAKYDPTNFFRHNQNVKPAG